MRSSMAEAVGRAFEGEVTRGKPVVVPAKEILKPTTSIVGKKEVDPQGNLVSSSANLIASNQKESFCEKKIRLLSKWKEANKVKEVVECNREN